MTKKYPLHSFFKEAPPLDRPCAHENCPLKGEFKAPRSREELRNYLWFCLSHVRLYNEKWNYYEGMDPFEVDCEQLYFASEYANRQNIANAIETSKMKNKLRVSSEYVEKQAAMQAQQQLQEHQQRPFFADNSCKYI